MSDIVFDNSEKITVLCSSLNVHGADFVLDSLARRKPNGPKLRRALVHDFNDGLTLNFNGDYPGGVSINGALNVTGNIQFQIPRNAFVVTVTGHPAPPETVTLADVVRQLRDQIAALTARITALEAGR